MHILNANDLFGITAYTYDRIMEVGGKYGADAFAVYFKLLEQTRIQQTNQTFTLNKFLMKFFSWGDDRVSRAKKILKDLGLIDDVVVRDEFGKMKAHYVRVNYLIDDSNIRNACSTYNLSTTTENQGVDSTWTGEIETNALSTKHINALSTKEKICLPEQEILDNIEERKENVAAKEKKERSPKKSKKRMDYPEDYERIWRIYPHNHCVKQDVYGLWQQYSDEEKARFLIGAQIEELEWNYVKKGKVRMSNRMDRWMDSYTLTKDWIPEFVDIVDKLNNIEDEQTRKEGLDKAREYFGEDYVRTALSKVTKRITLEFH